MQRSGMSVAPVNVGDELDVAIEAVGEKGDGIAKVKGFVLFVPNVKEGESCKIRVTKVLKKVGFAEKIGEASGEVKVQPKREENVQMPPEPEEERYKDTDTFGEEEQAEQ